MYSPETPSTVTVNVFRSTFKRMKLVMKRINTQRQAENLPPLRTYEVMTAACDAWILCNEPKE